MKIAIIGGGASGIFAAIRIKEKHPNFVVSVFEHNEKLLKKIYATGNGKCNFANVGSLEDKYSNPKFALPILKEYDYKELISFLDSLGIHNKQIGELIYPISESAETVAKMLLKRVSTSQIDIHLEEKVADYKSEDKITLLTSKGKYEYDKLIIAVGGKAAPQLGSDGNLFNILIDHGYKVKEMNPSLCPIVIKEDVKRLDGVRCKVEASLYQKDKIIHNESGELLFKKDGLSGIVIFNLSHYINELKDKNDIKIHIDFAKGYKVSKDQYEEYVNSKLADYLSYRNLDINNVLFTFKKMYDYQYAQVTSGGISFENLNGDLSSKIEKNIYFIGEAVDVDAVCGGFNLMWAFASAEKVNKNI